MRENFINEKLDNEYWRWKRMKQLEVRYEGQYSIYSCPIDHKILALVHDSGSGTVYSPCQHFEWNEYGNLYYELMARRLNQNAVLRVFNGTTVYILYPKSQ